MALFGRIHPAQANISNIIRLRAYRVTHKGTEYSAWRCLAKAACSKDLLFNDDNGNINRYID